jgi:hypothetical protein
MNLIESTQPTYINTRLTRCVLNGRRTYGLLKICPRIRTKLTVLNLVGMRVYILVL